MSCPALAYRRIESTSLAGEWDRLAQESCALVTLAASKRGKRGPPGPLPSVNLETRRAGSRKVLRLTAGQCCVDRLHTAARGLMTDLGRMRSEYIAGPIPSGVEQSFWTFHYFETSIEAHRDRMARSCAFRDGGPPARERQTFLCVA